MEGLDKAVMSMKKGETALLTIAPEYAFGSSESKQELAVVPPNSTVFYEVELVSFVKVSVKRYTVHVSVQLVSIVFCLTCFL